MITFPNAKINLGLNIVERRLDGYHNIETVFYPIPLTDVLEIVPVQETSLTCYGNPVDCPPEKNLVMRAYRMLQEHYDLSPVAIHLYKHIPDGAGLGGGSSDAAHALLMLNQMFNLGISEADLATMAATLGADCAFFIYNRPMLATGIGDVLTPVDVRMKSLPRLSGAMSFGLLSEELLSAELPVSLPIPGAYTAAHTVLRTVVFHSCSPVV